MLFAKSAAFLRCANPGPGGYIIATNERSRSRASGIPHTIEKEMNSQKPRVVGVISCVLLLCACSAQAQKPPQHLEISCLHFTQDFYSRYVKSVFEKPHSKSAEDPLLAALNYEGHPFSHELEQGLRKVKAEEKSSHEAILDFDPILNSQDPADHYVVRKITEKNGHYWAEVYGIWSRPPSGLGTGPQVVAELVFEKGRWMFVNFHYPDSTDPRNESLLSMLRYALSR